MQGVGDAGQWVLTAAQARRFDALATERFRIPSLLLMEHAAMGAAAVAKVMLRAAGEAARGDVRSAKVRGRGDVLDMAGSVVLIAGPGNNGGDALAMARLLRADGFHAKRVRVIALREQFKGDATAQRAMIEGFGVRVDVWDGASAARRRALTRAMRDATLVVDGLFGTGLDRPVAGEALGLVDAVNAARQDAAGPLVLSLDLPSGMHADRGVPKGWEHATVHADVTATFAALKPGLLTRGAKAYAGAVVPVSLGVPEALYRLVGARRASPLGWLSHGPPRSV